MNMFCVGQLNFRSTVPTKPEQFLLAVLSTVPLSIIAMVLLFPTGSTNYPAQISDLGRIFLVCLAERQDSPAGTEQ